MLADQKKTVFDEDLIAIVDEQTRAEEFARYTSTPSPSISARISVRQPPCVCVPVTIFTSRQRLRRRRSGCGISVIKKLTHTEDTVLQDYRVGAVTMGTDARVQPMWF